TRMADQIHGPTGVTGLVALDLFVQDRDLLPMPATAAKIAEEPQKAPRPVVVLDRIGDAPIDQSPHNAAVEPAMPFDAGQDNDVAPFEPPGIQLRLHRKKRDPGEAGLFRGRDDTTPAGDGLEFLGLPPTV